MAIPSWQATIQNATGDVVPSAEVEVFVEATGLNASIFSDRAGAVALANPFFADTNGFAQFYAAPSEYRIVATGPSGVRTWRYVVLVGTATDNTWTGDQTFAGNADITGTLGVTGQATVDDIDVTGESTGPGELVNGKYIGELIFIDGPAKAPSANFPALCVSTIDTFATIDEANWPDLVPIERAKLATYLDTGAGGTTTFAGNAAGSVITLASNTANNAMLAALERHAAAYGDDFASVGAVRWQGADFAITDVDAVARTITVTGTPTAGAGDAQFYPHRIAGSTTTARIQSWRGRAPVGANGAEGQTVSGFMRRDQMQRITGELSRIRNTGVGTQIAPLWSDAVVSGVFSRGSAQEGDGVTQIAAGSAGYKLLFSSAGSADARVSATAAEANATHPADGSVNIYKHGGRYIAP
jgi:hypothetical protein